jgi:tetratricopeptide (TPR) repeat protein
MLLNHIRPLCLIVVAALMAGCASQQPSLHTYLDATEFPASLELRETPFFPQQVYQCGPAALATLLAASGAPVSPEKLASQVYLPERQGSLQVELVAASRRYGRLPYLLEPDLAILLSELHAGRPVLVLQNLGLASYPTWHYAVVVGFDAGRNEIILRSGITERLSMRLGKFMRSWGLADYWAMIALQPGEVPGQVNESRYVQAIAAMESVAPPDIVADFYATALSMWPANETALFGLGNTCFAQGELPEAESYYRRLIALQPEHMAARNNLAQLLADKGCNAAALVEIDAGLAIIDSGNSLRQHLIETREGILGNISGQGSVGALYPDRCPD